MIMESRRKYLRTVAGALGLVVLLGGCGKKAAPFLPRPLSARTVTLSKVLVQERTLSIEFKIPKEIFSIEKEEEPWSLARLLRSSPGEGGAAFEERTVVREAVGFAFGQRLTLTDTGIAGKTYRYRVELRKEKAREWAESETVAISGTALPRVEEGILAEGREGAVAISWKAPPDASQDLTYVLYRRGGRSGETVRLNEEPLTERKTTDTRITREEEYCYRIQTTRRLGVVEIIGPLSDEVCARSTDQTPPPAPGGVILVSMEGAFRLSWLPVESGDVGGYNVYRSSDRRSFVRINREIVQGTQYRDEDVESGIEYGYRVTAVDDSARANESPFSEIVTSIAP